MKKFILTFLLTSLVMAIEVDPWFPVVGQKVKFKVTNIKAYSMCYDVVWDFGDGTIIHASGRDSILNGVYHIYKDPGTYIVKIANFSCHKLKPPPEKAKFTVKDDRNLKVEIPVRP